jgi:hypothetical protein
MAARLPRLQDLTRRRGAIVIVEPVGHPSPDAWTRAFAAIDHQMGRTPPARRRPGGYFGGPSAVTVTQGAAALSGTGTLTAAATQRPGVTLTGTGTLTASATAA